MTRVWLHGFTGSPASFAELAPGEPAPALLGHGAPVAAATFDDEVDRVAALVAPGAHLIGYSMGARVALGVLARHPGRVARATLIGCHPGLADPRARRERAGDDARWIALLSRSGVEAFVDAWDERPLWATQRAVAPRALARQRAIRLSHTADGLAAALRVLGLAAMPDCAPALPGIDVPVLLVTGALDGKFTAVARDLARALPRAEHAVIDGCGHNPILERPDELRRLITDKE